ncbi:PTS transporter subunit EIIC [Spiroplasma poulsonii]|uniref:PTS transporter subunit EIIC n=1 Tax=Spiroplasma poulsonii TaxID=2138 RepID=UPI001F4CACA4|nr:PTS transporter subunit EIIC [Spiroplasma poulsonii]UNF62230.1 PTS transporter subunit EIIC [Spiroplasma poulsonii]
MGESVRTKPNKFTAWLNNKFIPTVGKIGNQTHLSIIRDSFALITSLLIAGALAVFINQIILGSSVISLSYWIAYWSKMHNGFDGDNIVFLPNAVKALEALKSVNGVIWNASLMVMTLYIVFLIGYLLGKRRGQDPAIMAGIVSFATFIVAEAGIGGWEFAHKFMGAERLFSGIIIAFLSAELFIFLQRNNRLAIRMSKNVPPAVGHAFAKLLPMIITTFLFGIVSQLLIWAPIEYTVIDQFNAQFTKQADFAGIFRNTEGEMFQLLNGTLESLTDAQIALVKKIEYLTMTADSMWGQFGPLKDIATNSEYSAFNLNFKALTLVTLIYNFIYLMNRQVWIPM